MGGSFHPEQVAGFTGMGGRFAPEYAFNQRLRVTDQTLVISIPKLLIARFWPKNA
jgi:hypothetical protein